MPGAMGSFPDCPRRADRTQPANLDSSGWPRASMGACRSRTNADDRLPLDPLGRVEGGGGIVEGRDVAWGRLRKPAVSSTLNSSISRMTKTMRNTSGRSSMARSMRRRISRRATARSGSQFAAISGNGITCVSSWLSASSVDNSTVGRCRRNRPNASFNALEWQHCTDGRRGAAQQPPLGRNPRFRDRPGYKPQPKVYLATCEAFNLKPEQVMMCAAHSGDLSSAQKLGMRTGHIGRPGEGGPGTGETEPKGTFDVVGKNFNDFADKLGV